MMGELFFIYPVSRLPTGNKRIAAGIYWCVAVIIQCCTNEDYNARVAWRYKEDLSGGGAGIWTPDTADMSRML